MQWRRLIGEGGDQPGEGERRFNGVKYVSPEFGGFTASAAWGEDDFWDMALRYKGDFAGFSLAAGIGYGKITRRHPDPDDRRLTRQLDRCASSLAGR